MTSSLDIVLPCYNPLPHWEDTVIRNIEYISKSIDRVHLIVVNDGSKQDLSSAIAKLKKEIPQLTYVDLKVNGGKGKALRAGIRQTKSEQVIFTDIDFPYTKESFMNIYQELLHHDVVIGVRDRSYYDNIPAKRRYISKLLKQVNKSLLRLPSSDTQGGLKGMSAAGRDVFLQTEINRYLIDLDFLQLVGKTDLRFKEVVVELRPDVAISEVGLKILSSELKNFFKILFRF